MKKCYIVALKEETNGVSNILGDPIFYCGIGKINAAIHMTELIKEGYDNITNIGSCGSMKHKVGELLKVGEVYQDIDLRPICEYGNYPNESSSIIELNKDSKISCFTTDYFFDEKFKNKYSQEYMNMIQKSSLFDMECYSYAMVAKKYKIKFSSYKWVSDDGNFNNWLENCKLGFNKFIELIKQ